MNADELFAAYDAFTTPAELSAAQGKSRNAARNTATPGFVPASFGEVLEAVTHE
jgi:hypothetical protein